MSEQKKENKSDRWIEIYNVIKTKTNWAEKFNTIVKIINRPIPNIAVEIGFSLTGFNSVLKGIHNPSFSMLNDMVIYLHIKKEWLFSLTNDGQKQEIFFNYEKIRGSRKDIAERIKEIRKERNLTQVMLSQATGLSSKTINCAENEKIDLLEESIEKIADACNVGFYWLLSGFENSRNYPCNKRMTNFLWSRVDIRNIIWKLMHEDVTQSKNYYLLGNINNKQKNTSINNRDGTKHDEKKKNAKEIGERIHKLRAERELSLRAFAERADVSKSGMSVWESGRASPDDFIIRRIGEAFDVGADWIKYGDETKKQYPCDQRMIEFLNDNPEIRKKVEDFMGIII